MWIAHSRCEFGSTQKTGDRAYYGRDITRLVAAECQQDSALVVIADQRRVAGIIEKDIQGAGGLGHALTCGVAGAAQGAEADKQHFERESAVGRRLLLAHAIP